MTDSPIAAREGERRPITIPVISLWMPWANWVMLGWKTIETRLHKRFYSLAGKTIGIHASLRWDDEAIDAARPYLTDKQIAQTLGFLRVGGAIIGTVYVPTVRELAAEDSARALIDCDTVKRHGLELMYRNPIEAIPCRGKQGIWYADVPQSAIVAEDVAKALRQGIIK